MLPPRPVHGFTLIELLISMGILGLVMTIVTMSLDSGTRLNDRVTRQTDINNRANEVLNKLAMQLRLASAGATTASSLELPGAFPLGYTPADPTKPGNVRAYYYAVSTGLGSAPTWTEQYEPFKRMIIYDYSVSPGRIVLQTRDSAGVLQPEQLLTDQVDDDGFTLTRVGNTLRMNLTLRSETRAGEEIIYTAQAQTLFLRSTLNESSGSSAVTFVDNPEDVGGVVASTTDLSPSIMFGNLVTELTTSPPQQQVSIFITAPIGQKVDPKSITVYLGNSDDTQSLEVAEGATVTVDTATVTRATHPPPSQWPSQNGTYSVTLTGQIPSTVTLKAVAATVDGHATDSANIPTKRYR
jgi:prepilin-type N-terminal cleavage/methylation domain-containing protein